MWLRGSWPFFNSLWHLLKYHFFGIPKEFFNSNIKGHGKFSWKICVWLIFSWHLTKSRSSFTMADAAHSELIAQFTGVTGVDTDRAKFFLESAGWNLDVSIYFITKHRQKTSFWDVLLIFQFKRMQITSHRRSTEPMNWDFEIILWSRGTNTLPPYASHASCDLQPFWKIDPCLVMA